MAAASSCDGGWSTIWLRIGARGSQRLIVAITTSIPTIAEATINSEFWNSAA
jgi:hypothetical protein